MDPCRDAGPPGPASAADAPGWRERLLRELRSRPIAWVIFALFVAAGPVVVTYLFPEAPTGVALVGGAIFGGYCALNAVPQKFL